MTTDDLRTRAREAAGMLYPEPQDDSLTYPHSAVRGYMRAALTKGALWHAAGRSFSWSHPSPEHAACFPTSQSGLGHPPTSRAARQRAPLVKAARM